MDILSPKDKTEFRSALAALLERPGLTSAEQEEHIDGLIRYCQRRGVSLAHCLVGRENGRTLSVCLCIDGAGRMSSLFIPTQTRFLAPPTAIVQLVEEQIGRARQRNVQLLQGTVIPEAVLETDVYRAARFDYLTRLIYMDSEVSRLATMPDSGFRVDWTAYGDATHSFFASAIQGTYEHSLDCAALNGVRDIEDILASHRAAGEFDPRLWHVASIAGEPAGVILLSRLPERWALEVVYMGVLPSWRGRGCGISLLRRAVETARAQALPTLTLTVDKSNIPALRLYSRFGFQETARRDVWLRKL